MEAEILHLRDRRVIAANLYDLGMNAVAATGVLGAASRALPVGTAVDAFLVAAEAVAGVALLVAIVGELRQLRAGEDRDGGIAWVTLFAGIVLAAECLQSYLDRGRVSDAAALTTVVTIVLAVLQPRLKRRRLDRRSVRLSDDGVLLRLGRFRRFEAAWDDITALRRDGSTLHVELRGGRTKELGLGAFTNRDELFGLLIPRAAARGIRVSG